MSPPPTKRQRVDNISDAAILYHAAVAAQHDAVLHLQQVMLPDVAAADAVHYPSDGILEPDSLAANKAHSLQLYALDLLRIGLSLPLTLTERAAFTVEYAVVGIKEGIYFDEEVAAMLAACEPQMEQWRRRLEWLSVRIAILQGRHNIARRAVRRYGSRLDLLFLILDAATEYAEFSSLIEEIGARPDAPRGLLALIRARAAFVHRRWDAVPQALDELARTIGWREEALVGRSPLHYLILRCLWEGRIGNDEKVRALLKRIYLVMDEGVESGAFDDARRRGGLLDIGDLSVQTTPPNILFLLIFLTTVTTRRDYVGTCKTLLHARAMREYAATARRDDMWDLGFSSFHSVADAWSIRESVFRCLDEMRIEEATALLFRSDFAAADALLGAISLDLAPQLCLAHAQLTQLLGYDPKRYYQAALQLLVPNSELGLLVQAGMSAAGVSGFDVAERCTRSTNVVLQIVGQLLLALSQQNLMIAKKQISAVYDLCQRSNNNLLRALVFAFTSTTHLTGSDDRVQKQLETGLEIAGRLGEGVGQAALGLWFAVKLKSVHNRRQDLAQLAISRSLMQRYLVRLGEVMEYGRMRWAAQRDVASRTDSEPGAA